MKGSTGKIFSAGMYPAGYIFHSIPKICVFAVSKSLLPETLSMLDEKKMHGRSPFYYWLLGDFAYDVNTLHQLGHISQ